MSNAVGAEAPFAINVHGLRVVTRTGLALVDGLDLAIRRGEALALVGESGCGKSLTAMALIGLLPPYLESRSDELLIAGRDASDARSATWRAIRGREVGFVAQDSAGTLNPVFTIGFQMTAAISLHHPRLGAAADSSACELLARMRLPDPARLMRAYPHQLSGGQRQRVALALALASDPMIIIADEPTTALDAVTKLEMLELLHDARRTRERTLLLITHDISLLRRFVTHVAVMYSGRIVEHGPVGAVLDGPAHPYTRGLLAAQPVLSGGRRRLLEIPGQVPGPATRPVGCRFANRCPDAASDCGVEPPERRLSASHVAWCVRAESKLA